MMMNDRVEIGVCAERGVSGGGGVDEKLALLHRTLKRIAKARAHLDLQEAEALREAQQLRLWRQFGHASLADYMVQELGYSTHRVAEERLRVANALPALPEISKAIENGEINFCKARELVRVATPENEQAWLGMAKEMNVREVEQAVAGHAKGDLPEDPVDPRLVRKTIWLSVRPETEVLFRETRRALDKERGEKLDEDAALEALCRAYLSVVRTCGDRVAVSRRSDHVPPPTDQASVPRGCDPDSVPRGSDPDSAPGAVDPRQLTMFDVGEPASEVVGEPRMTAVSRSDGAVSRVKMGGYGAVSRVEMRGSGAGGAAARCELAVRGDSGDLIMSPASTLVVSGAAPYRIAVTICSQCKRGWQHGGGAVEEMTLAAVGRAQCDAQWIGDLDSGVVERARQEIPPATRRKIMHRDQERCQVPGCQCFTNLDVHHIRHRALGGTHELWNLITLCEAHHLAHHEGALRIERVDGELKFTWEGKNRLARISHEIATRKALCERNVGRDLVAEVLRRTIAHVGDDHLSDDEWLVIALRYVNERAT